MKKLLAVLTLAMIATLGTSATFADCNSIDNYAARQACKGDCNAIDNYGLRQACQGDCNAIDNYSLRQACKGDCNAIDDYSSREACKSCGGGGRWSALNGLGYNMSCN